MSNLQALSLQHNQWPKNNINDSYEILVQKTDYRWYRYLWPVPCPPLGFSFMEICQVMKWTNLEIERGKFPRDRVCVSRSEWVCDVSVRVCGIVRDRDREGERERERERSTILRLEINQSRASKRFIKWTQQSTTCVAAAAAVAAEDLRLANTITSLSLSLCVLL